MRLSERIRALEQRTADQPAAADVREYRSEEFWTWVPEDLRAAVAERLNGPYAEDPESYASWALWPFARWAPDPGQEFRFPRALVEWLLDPPHRFWMGHHCGRCGLSVPLHFTSSNGLDRPTDLRVFPLCPTCGGATSHDAHYRPDALTPTSEAPLESETAL